MTAPDRETLAAAVEAASHEFQTCNGPRDCSGTERGCRHCSPGGEALHVADRLLASDLGPSIHKACECVWDDQPAHCVCAHSEDNDGDGWNPWPCRALLAGPLAPVAPAGDGGLPGDLASAVEQARLRWINDLDDGRDAMQIAAEVGVAFERQQVVRRLRREADAEGTDVGQDRLLDIAASIGRGEHLGD